MKREIVARESVVFALESTRERMRSARDVARYLYAFAIAPYGAGDPEWLMSWLCNTLEVEDYTQLPEWLTGTAPRNQVQADAET